MRQENNNNTMYRKLKDKYIDPFTDFGFKKLFGEECNKDFKYRYDIMLTDTDTHKVFYDKLKFVYLEMPKFTKEIDELETHFEKWMYVLKNLKRLDNIPDKLREKIFERIFSVAEIAKLTPEEYRAYVDNLSSYRDLKNSLDYAEAKGRAEGKAEGEQERLKLLQEHRRVKKTVEKMKFTGIKKLIYILGIAVFLYSCDKLESNPEKFELGSLQKILDGYVVTAIAFDSKGNAWVGTQGQGVIRYNEKETVVYNSYNSVLPEKFVIWDMAVDKNDNVWIGSDGVWKYDRQEFTLYNSQNTAMPEDIVWSIAVDSKNNIWMASCRFLQGGLVKYDGAKWTTYTPENSPLPANFIKGIAIDKSDNVWLALGDYVNQAYLVKISQDNWNLYGEKDLGFKPYYLGGIQCDSKNRLWATLDYSLSSTWISPSPHFFIFDGKNTTQLSCGDNMHLGGLRSGITIDHNDYAWCFGVGSESGVWIGKQWKQFDFNGEYAGGGVWVIKEDASHRIWLGTENGIYIRN
jgi:hypothetical protein